MIQVTVYLEKHHGMFLGWIDEFKGVAAQGKTKKEVMTELLLLGRIKIAFDHNLQLSDVSAKEVCNINERIIKQEENKFQLAL